MKIKRIELTEFKRFTHLIVESIPKTAKLVILVGPNGSGKTSFLEALMHLMIISLLAVKSTTRLSSISNLHNVGVMLTHLFVIR